YVGTLITDGSTLIEHSPTSLIFHVWNYYQRQRWAGYAGASGSWSLSSTSYVGAGGGTASAPWLASYVLGLSDYVTAEAGVHELGVTEGHFHRVGIARDWSSGGSSSSTSMDGRAANGHFTNVA